MQLKLDPKFRKKMQARFDRFDMQVGILEDANHRNAAPASKGLASYAGGPLRKKGSPGELTIAEVAEEIRKEQNVEWLEGPFKNRSSDILKFTDGFLRMASGKATSMRKRVENLMQAIVRNPILRGDYGSNSAQARKWKTFDRYLMDTGQFFKGITAKVKIRGRDA